MTGIEAKALKTAHVDGADIRYELSGGQGEPLLLVHGSNLATGLRPLAGALEGHAPRLNLVRYHRRGMGGTTGRERPISVGRQATDALALLDSLGMASAHILGYSYGATISIQAALTAPDRIRSLILLEPILSEVSSAQTFFSGMKPILKHYAADDMEGAVTATFAGLGGRRWPDLLATAGPDTFAAAVRDTEVFYETEWPELTSWTIDPEQASAMSAPVLHVLGTRSGPFFTDGRRLIHQHFPQCRNADIPDANHLLNLQAPEVIAAKVARFLAENSLRRHDDPKL